MHDDELTAAVGFEPSATLQSTGGSKLNNQGPATAYAERRRQRSDELARLEARDRLLANLRLATAALGMLAVWLCLLALVLPWGWLLPPVVVFVGLAALHSGVIRRRDSMARAVAFYDSGLARLEGRWTGLGRTGEAFADAEHPYANDLDLFGRGSLFELLSTARTEPGEATLAQWLLAAADIETIGRRQAAVGELRDRLDLRERLALLGADVAFDLTPGQLAAWGAAPPVITSRWPVGLALAAAAINIAALAAWFWLPYGSLPLLPAILVGGSFGFLWRRRVGAVLAAATRPRQQLLLLAELLRLLEDERFSAPGLLALQAKVRGSSTPASLWVRRLARLVEWNDSRRNVMFAPLAALLMLGSQLAFAIERWRRDAGADVATWLAAVGELEALCSLAGFAYENPDDPFPEIVALEAKPRLEALGLGHPLLTPQQCVRNDVRLGAEPQLLLISGSNMSGKSTLLRSVGVNVVLALAGATVRAHELRLSVLRIGASMRVVDSLQDGTSHFYAEITRLKQISELTAPGTSVLFLLDEILHGTNSHDRRIGAEGVIKSLVRKGALGLVTTHDLALARIADDLAPLAANVHFEDRIQDGRMVFDYRLRAGVVEKSNALDLMRGLGLDV